MSSLNFDRLTREYDDTLALLDGGLRLQGMDVATDRGVADLVARLFIAGLDEAGHTLLERAMAAFPNSGWLREDQDEEVLP